MRKITKKWWKNGVSYLQTGFASFPENFPDLKLQLLCASEGTSVQEEWSGSATLLFGAEARRIKMKKEKKMMMRRMIVVVMMMMITVIIAIQIIRVVSCSHNMSLWKAPKLRQPSKVLPFWNSHVRLPISWLKFLNKVLPGFPTHRKPKCFSYLPKQLARSYMKVDQISYEVVTVVTYIYIYWRILTHLSPISACFTPEMFHATTRALHANSPALHRVQSQVPPGLPQGKAGESTIFHKSSN